MTQNQKRRRHVEKEKGSAEHRVSQVERELGELKKVVGGMAGDLVKLRDYMVTQFEVRPPFSLPLNQIT